VGDILNIQKESEVNKFLIKNHLLTLEEKKSEFANDTLFKLHAVIHKNEVINYYLEKDEKLDKVLNIFIRVNSGGTQLSYSDLLLSIATAQWKDKDAREEITKFVDEISEIGNDFNFDKDFVLKACLILNDFPEIAFKVDNFNKKNMLTIEKNWDDVSQAIYLAVTLSASLGYNRDTLTSNIALIPIAYYLLKIELPDNFNQSSKYLNDRKKIQKWLICSLLKRVFSGQPDNVLRPIRHVIFKNHSSFPLEAIVDNFKGDVKSLIFSDDEIDNLFYYRYGKAYTFSTLALLYPSLDLRNRFHVDHIFPKSFFTKRKLIKKGISENKIEFYLDNFNYLANLQLLEGTPNQEKSNADFKEWLNKTYPNKNERKDYMEKHYIPDIEIDLNNFDNFIIERKRLMTQKYNNILKLF
ncbi:MAG: DUF262 domain-containing protein, partial [Actinobacteria bacterium]|nr:DUF262 domain-containing protein [Actinomycetota bacterium]